MKTLNLITLALLSTSEKDAFQNDLHNAGRQVGRREAKRANVYAVYEAVDGMPLLGKTSTIRFVTTFGNTLPSPFAILIGSARWSVTKGEYVVSTNSFLENAAGLHVYDALDLGVQVGRGEYEEAKATNAALEGLDDRRLAHLKSSFKESAWFATQEDAVLWSTRESGLQNCSGEVEYKSLEEGNGFVLRLIKGIATSTGQQVDGIWKATVFPNPEAQPFDKSDVELQNAEIAAENYGQ